MGGRSRGQGEGNKKRGQGEGNKKRRRGEGNRKRKLGEAAAAEELCGEAAAEEELRKIIREKIEEDEEFSNNVEKLMEVEEAMKVNSKGRFSAEQLTQIFGEAHVQTIGEISIARVNDENRQRVLAAARKASHAKSDKTGGFEAAVQESNTNENEKEAHCEVKCKRCKKNENENVEAGVEINETERRGEAEKKKTEAAAESSDDAANNELGIRTGAKKKKTKKNKKKAVEPVPEPKGDAFDRGGYKHYVDEEGRWKKEGGFMCHGCSQTGVVFKAANNKELQSHIEEKHKDFLARESTIRRAMKCNLCTWDGVEYYTRCEKDIQRHADLVHPGALPKFIEMGQPLFTVLTNVNDVKMRRINKMSRFTGNEKPMYRPPFSCVRCQIFFPEGQEKAFKHVQVHHPDARNRGICMGIPQNYTKEDVEESEKTLLENAGVTSNVIAKTVEKTQKKLLEYTKANPDVIKNAVEKAISEVLAAERIDLADKIAKSNATEEVVKNKKDEYSYLCWNCSKNKSEVDRLFKCGGCKVARYCSEDCKNNDWKEHGNWCLKKQQKRLARKAKKAAKTESELD